MIFKTFLNDISKKHGLSSAKERRVVLVEQMLSNEKSGNDCLSCTGKCCTFVANSMQMTSIEALEAIVLLESKGLLNEELKKRLEASVKDNRLDHLIQISNDEYFRRTYTCPFYFYPDFGCGLGIDHKPYGCIAFNPCSKGQMEGGDCKSDLDIQEKRQSEFEAQELLVNKFLEDDKGIDILKKPIPVKILEVWNYLSSKVI